MVRPKGLLLFHGAGGDKDHDVFVLIEEKLQIPVRRVNFNYRNQGKRRPPPRAQKLVDEVRTIASAWAVDLGIPSSHLLLGGRSMGGRVASMAVAGGLKSRGLVLLSYPLHPVGKPEKLRTDHFAEIERPCLFVSGDKDPFGKPALFDECLKSIPAKVTLKWLIGQGHNPKKDLETLTTSLKEWVEGLH
jgi:predicted alpha/beta-hydrolase family hydrolase